MRVLFCTLNYPPSPTGGAEKQAQLLGEALVRRGHAVHVVCPRTVGYRSETINGVRVHRLPRVNARPLRTVSYLPVLCAFLILHLRKYDLVHVHLANLQADVAVAVATAFRRPSYLKLAAGGRLGEIGRLSLVALVTRYYGIRHATLIQAISDEIASDVMRIGVPAERIRLIPNGVVPRPRLTPADRASARGRLGLPSDALVVLFAGRLEREKGVDDLISVWRAGKPEHGVLLLLGSAGIKDPVSMEDLPDGAEFRPWSSDVASYMAASDIFVLPSHVEGMSNSLLEAMAAGVASISTRVGATPEMIRDGGNGLLVDPGDRDSLAAALEKLAGDRALRIRVGEAARASACETFDIDSVVARIEGAYRSIVIST
jgi:glycosyltransferase involved in cell wall biosynthesis